MDFLTPPHFGAALIDGGWMISRDLDIVNGSSELPAPIGVLEHAHAARGFRRPMVLPATQRQSSAQGQGRTRLDAAFGVLITLERQAYGCVTGLTVCGRTHRFNYGSRIAAAKKSPENYRLIDDGTYAYSYRNDRITIKDGSGAAQSYSFSAARGLAIYVDVAGRVTKTYYVRAPGQKYDGNQSL